VRVFVAVDITPQVRSAVAALAERLRAATHDDRRFRWVRSEGMHVTLKFIGESPPEKVENIRAALAGVRLGEPVEMRFRGTGFFPSERRARVFWAGIEFTPNLAGLAGEVETRLEKLGIARETRDFKPHLTLARIEEGAPVPALVAASKQEGAAEFGTVRTTEMHLYQSVLKPTGAEYMRLQTFTFAGAAA